jgi:hypothetical protein
LKRSYKNGPQPMYLPLLSRPRFTPAQVEALDAIGEAYSASQLPWEDAVRIRDLIRAGDLATASREFQKAGRR